MIGKEREKKKYGVVKWGEGMGVKKGDLREEEEEFREGLWE